MNWRGAARWPVSFFFRALRGLAEERRTRYFAALEAAGAETQTDGLLYTDFCERQLMALEPLIELIAEVLQNSVDEHPLPDAGS